MAFKEGGVQSVESTAQRIGVTPQPLYFNYRLTKQVAALAEEVGRVEDLVIRCTRDGEKPHLIKEISYDGQLDRIADIIKNRSLTSVGILLPYNTLQHGYLSVEYVKNYLLAKGITCEFKYNANEETEMDLDFHTNNPKIMTWWCGKGLQFKDVFIPGCDNEFSAEKLSAMYVAITRCSERLYLGYTSKLDSFFPDVASPLYNQSNVSTTDML